MGHFHRLENPNTQPASLAVIQVASGEVWGRTPRGGLEPTVQAYAGEIGMQRGIEFTTDTAPHPNAGSPFEARWYLTRTPGVLSRCKGGEQFACILAVVRNFQL